MGAATALASYAGAARAAEREAITIAEVAPGEDVLAYIARVKGGFDLAVCCDLRIASTTTAFAHPEYSFTNVVYSPLHELVGGAVARELVYTGRRVDAAEALAMRLVSAVVEPEAVLTTALQYAAMMNGTSRALLMESKRKVLARARFSSGAATLEL